MKSHIVFGKPSDEDRKKAEKLWDAEQEASKLGLRLVREMVYSSEKSSKPRTKIESSVFPWPSRIWQSCLEDASKG